jgi:cellulose synthase/poly-beta-1,6-N-acetylglucosamine synthase-like glycosyltransferase
MALLFWIVLAICVYTYAGYPVLVFIAGIVRARAIGKAPFEPTVSILIAAHNEAAHIAATLENKLALHYPSGKLQIIVVSDGSTDGTDRVASAYPGITVLRQEPRRGKTAALNLAVGHATGEVLVFADANSLYAPDALTRLLRNFSDPEVGYVTGRMTYRSNGPTAVGIGCRAYMAYEDLLRRAETRLGSIVGVNGGIDAVRRALYVRMNDEQLPDFVLPLSVVRAGYRVVYEPDAVLTEDTLTMAGSEYRMRVRVALRTWWTLSEMRDLFDPRRYGFFAVQLFSHKPLRYLMGLMLPVLYALAWGLAASGGVFLAAALGGTLALAIAMAGFLIERFGRGAGAFGIPCYFVLVTAAACHALYDFLRGRRQTIWTPRTGLGG